MEIITKSLRKKAGKKLKGFGVVQGCCYHDGKLYVAFERGKNKANHAIKIARYSFPSLKFEKASKPLKLGHANDMTYKGGILYITHSGGKEYRLLHRVDAKTLTKKKDVKIHVPSKIAKSGGFSGIAKADEGFLIRQLTTKKILEVDKHFKVKGYFSVDKHWQIANGMTYHKNTLVRTYSQKQDPDKQRIAFFDMKGKCIKTKKIPIKAEMEGCFYAGGELYLTFYHKKKVKKKLKKECWIVKV